MALQRAYAHTCLLVYPHKTMSSRAFKLAYYPYNANQIIFSAIENRLCPVTHHNSAKLLKKQSVKISKKY